MGGIGSGRQKWACKPRVEALNVALRAGELRRRGALRDGACGTLTWGPPSEPVASIKFRSTESTLIVSYYVAYSSADIPCLISNGDDFERLIMSGFDLRYEIETIRLATVRGGFGGTRSYFCCPDPDCNRRVEVLYLAGARFRCRRCLGLVYESQYEDADHRTYRRANKLRARLRYERWWPFVRAPIVLPKRMWRRKFWRLQDEIDEADCIASVACAKRVEILAAKRAGAVSQAARNRLDLAIVRSAFPR